MDYKNNPKVISKYGCECLRGIDPHRNDYKEENAYIFKQFKKLKDLKEKKNYRKYPNPEKIIDFNFIHGQPVAVADKEKKPPRPSKIKMKHYGGDGWITSII